MKKAWYVFLGCDVAYLAYKVFQGEPPIAGIILMVVCILYDIFMIDQMEKRGEE